MIQKLEKLKANMLVILDLTQNQHKRMLLQKEILMQKLLSSKIILKNYKHLIRAILEIKIILMKMVNKIIQYFLPIGKYFRINGKCTFSWKSKGLSDKTITLCATSDKSLTPLIEYYGTKIRLAFHKSCLKQSNKLTYDKGHIVNVHIVYKLGASSSNNSDPTLKNCLFGAVTLTKKYRY